MVVSVVQTEGGAAETPEDSRREPMKNNLELDITIFYHPLETPMFVDVLKRPISPPK